MDSIEIRKRIIRAGRRAVEELIKVAEEGIIVHDDPESDIAPDRLKNAAATKKLAIFDAFEILSRVEQEEQALNGTPAQEQVTPSKQGFAERRAK
jgi:hypothetical protein